MSEATRILFCQCSHAGVLPFESQNAVLQRMREANLQFAIVPDLCERVAQNDPMLRRFAQGESVKVVACFPRAVKWLFAGANAPLPGTAEVLNLRTQSAEEIIANLLTGVRSEGIAVAEQGSASSEVDQTCNALPEGQETRSAAWFPVIDFDRCTHCMQCLGFCLFGVYGVDSERRIQVQNPANCKPLCPACSRVCPEAAIIFPKYKSSPISGDTINNLELQREAMKVDVSALLGGDVYSLLRSRSDRAKSRFSAERDAEKALQERQRCLAALAGLDGIPPEVLANLPSTDELKRRAEEATAKAQAARNNRV